MTPSQSLPPKAPSFKVRSISLLLVSSLALVGCASTKTAKPPVAETTAPIAASNSEAASTMAPTAPVASAPVASAPLAPATMADTSGQSETSNSAESLSPYASLAEAGERIFFPTDRFDLTDEARSILTRQAAWIKANPGKRVLIAGNCDERGTREYNLALGARRASAARDFLAGLGVDTDRIETVSYGKERPIDERPSAEGWAVNRNAQTMLLD
ncbi:MAG: OmpA family protein [Hyphomonadaceae bacterium]|jgi:peptidoglycan-associated lipoprotein|uniref:OmpA family protein n=1 Tax=Aquidulcibacter sp. TaxID=2052990 RepID=UPI0022C8D1F8|nr:OmpA family protein [Aquidulcibacter sp.]MCZ8209207.1 OmpA family protein [Aquidulcibacter sp.]